ncbi:mobile mystery protein B [Antribacter sp. KLBMP9083]|uniref:Mobile mystery protein B n=1 Tax=Antribacter soli TaxID=2910976 RepID=A0AA41QDE2_9MICO|nr:mobile mystery protein B [Antribacter soli]
MATREELNTVEQANIADALTTLLFRRRSRSLDQVLDDKFVRDMHRRMFGDVWAWAGTYRTTERNIGIDPYQVPVAVRDLMDNARHWFADGVTWISPDEALCKVHHRLVAIHPFPNGNGRLARAFTDVLARASGRPPFTWGGGSDLQATNPDRDAYLTALRQIDRNPEDVTALGALITFARS